MRHSRCSARIGRGADTANVASRGTGPRALIWHAQQVRERQIDRVVALAVAAIVLVLVGLVAALGFLVGWLPAAILFAAVVLLVFMVLVAS